MGPHGPLEPKWHGIDKHTLIRDQAIGNLSPGYQLLLDAKIKMGNMKQNSNRLMIWFLLNLVLFHFDLKPFLVIYKLIIWILNTPLYIFLLVDYFTLAERSNQRKDDISSKSLCYYNLHFLYAA